MQQNHPPSDASRKKRLASRARRFVGELAYGLAILAVANRVTNLIVPMPFDLFGEAGRPWSTQEHEAVTRWFSRSSWVEPLVIVGCALVFGVVRSYVSGRMRRR